MPPMVSGPAAQIIQFVSPLSFDHVAVVDFALSTAKRAIFPPAIALIQTVMVRRRLPLKKMLIRYSAQNITKILATSRPVLGHSAPIQLLVVGSSRWRLAKANVTHAVPPTCVVYTRLSAAHPMFGVQTASPHRIVKLVGNILHLARSNLPENTSALLRTAAMRPLAIMNNSAWNVAMETCHVTSCVVLPLHTQKSCCLWRRHNFSGFAALSYLCTSQTTRKLLQKYWPFHIGVHVCMLGHTTYVRTRQPVCTYAAVALQSYDLAFAYLC